MANLYTSSNMGTISSGIKWYVDTMSPTEHPDYDSIITSRTDGKMGDIIVITDENIKRLRYVANVFDNTIEQNDSVNIYINDSAPNRRINFFNGWYFDAKFYSQIIVINNQTMFCPVYFWNEFNHRFESIQIGYIFKDNLNLPSFTGMDIDVDEYMATLDIQQELTNYTIIVPIRVNNLSNNLSLTSFTGMDIDVDNIMSSLSYGEELTVKINNIIVIGE